VIRRRTPVLGTLVLRTPVLRTLVLRTLVLRTLGRGSPRSRGRVPTTTPSYRAVRDRLACDGMKSPSCPLTFVNDLGVDDLVVPAAIGSGPTGGRAGLGRTGAGRGGLLVKLLAEFLHAHRQLLGG
jgi:hypothetical protein